MLTTMFGARARGSETNILGSIFDFIERNCFSCYEVLVHTHFLVFTHPYLAGKESRQPHTHVVFELKTR